MSTPAQFYDHNGELRMDGTLVGGGGAQTAVGAFVQVTGPYTSDNYDQGTIEFALVDADLNPIGYDSDGFWNDVSHEMLVPDGLGGLYVVSAAIALNGSEAFTSPAEFEVLISGTAWNFDPLVFGLTPVFTANRYRGSVSLPIHLRDGCHVSVDGFWGGSATAKFGPSCLSIFRLADLAE